MYFFLKSIFQFSPKSDGKKKKKKEEEVKGEETWTFKVSVKLAQKLGWIYN